ncbi:MAG: alpha/beta fold hydrolase [Pseudohongiella sp.]|nr:alpha/beta fold hydrolase [Pseudohongiella sp.]
MKGLNADVSFGEPFVAPWWMPGGHLQTVWRKLQTSPQLLRHRRRIGLSDGDFIDVDFETSAARTAGSQKPLVFLLHGLAGSADSPYMIAMQHELSAQGFESVAMNLRGCSGEFNRSAVAYHSGCSHDVEQVISALVLEMPPEQKLVVIGYSLGANVLVKWLSETAHQNRVLAGVSVSNPFLLALCCGRMNNGAAYWYGRYFLSRLRRDLEAKRQHFERSGYDDQLQIINALGSLNSVKTLWDFDDAVTAPLHGFSSAEDYYDRCSSRQFLPAVQVPVLLVHGRNDPIIPEEALPLANESGASIYAEVLNEGGHVGFVARGQRHWLERRIVHFIRHHIEHSI